MVAQKEKLTVAYCLKCRDRCEMVNITEEDMANGRLGLRGKCSDCDANMYKMGRRV